MSGLMHWVRKVATRLRFNRRYRADPGTLTTTAEGLQLVRYVVRGDAIVQEPAWTLVWSDVTSVWAFKRDLAIVDQVCLDLQLGDGTAAFVSEDMRGFDHLVEILPEALPGVDASWWGKVVLPPFATNATLIWRGAAEQRAEADEAQS